MSTSSKYCRTCKQPYENHIHYILDTWDHTDPLKYTKANEKLSKVECNRFVLMDNLEFLEMKVNEAEHNE